MNGNDPSGLCNKQGNGNAWDFFNPLSSNNPIRCHVEHHSNDGLTHALEMNPAFHAIQSGNQAYEAAQNPCTSNWTIAKYSAESLFWSSLTVAGAFGLEQGGAYVAANPAAAAALTCLLIFASATEADTAMGNPNIPQPYERVTSAKIPVRDAPKGLCE